MEKSIDPKLTGHGHVTQLLEGFGFVETPDGHKLRFHRESCIEPGFEQLEVGDAVQFVAGYGPDGLHAKRVSALKHQGL